MNLRNLGKLIIFLALLLFSSGAEAFQYTYDSLNRLTRITYDSGAVIEYAYDAAGNLVAVTQAGIVVVTAPGAPTITSIVTGINQAMIYFTPPANNGGSAITSYTGSCSATGQLTRTAVGSGSPLTVLDLIRGVAYECMVTATNGDGLTGSASDSMALTLKSDFPWTMFLPAITRGGK